MATFNGWNIIPLPAYPPCPQSIEWKLTDVVGAAVSPFSLQQQTQDWQQSKLSWSVSYQLMSRSQAAPWRAFLMAVRGIENVFQIGDPDNVGPQNPAAVAGSVTGSGQTGYTLVTSSSNLTAGDWIQIGLRLYGVTSVAGGTLGIWPPIRESPADGSALVITNTQGLFRLIKNDRGYTINARHSYQFTFEIEEAL